MKITGTVHCFFEQSGTFKNEFRKLGYEAEDYDIQNEFGETDHIIDLFTEIEICYRGGASVNGRFYSGGYSGHCVKIGNGKTRDYVSESIRNILPQIPLLQDVDFRSGSYEEVELPSADRTTIYCDIPYKGTKQYTTSKDFNYNKFYDWCRKSCY